MPLLITRAGLEVLDFIRIDLPIIPEVDSEIPLTWTMVIARFGDGYISVYNFNRHQWEIPSGGIEPGEKPQECARRELLEESSQIAGDLVCTGLFQMRVSAQAEMQYCVVFYTEIATLQPFVANNETNRLRIWKQGDLVEKSTELSRWVMENMMGLDFG